MIGSVKRGSAHAVFAGMNGDRSDALRFVQMFDRDAAARWDGTEFVFRSDKLREAGKREAVIEAMKIRWPKLVARFED